MKKLLVLINILLAPLVKGQDWPDFKSKDTIPIIMLVSRLDYWNTTTVGSGIPAGECVQREGYYVVSRKKILNNKKQPFIYYVWKWVKVPE